jgi:hypothetical protein
VQNSPTTLNFSVNIPVPEKEDTLMWVPWVVEGAKIVLTWALLELIYGEPELDPAWLIGGDCPS